MKVSSKIFGFLTVLGLAVAVFQGCGSDKKDPDTSTGATVSFTTDVLPIVKANCTVSGCHDGTVAPTKSALETEATFKSSNSGVRVAMATGNALIMPPSSKTALTTAEKAKIADFLAGK